MYITIELLKKHNACEEQVALFATTFPKGVHVTEAACLAVADQFDFQWAADNLLPSDKKAEYMAQRAPISAEYMAQRAPISAEYEAQRASLWAEYEAKRAPLWTEYAAKCATIRAEYRRQMVVSFGQIASTLED